MYDSKNLPLSFRKVIKKTLESFLRWFFIFIFISCGLVFGLVKDGNSASGFQWFLLVLMIILLICFFVSFFWQYLYYRLYFYDFVDDGGTIMKGVIARATGHVSYNRLQNIYIDQDLLDRIFGLYDVHYETAGETSGFYSHVDGLNKVNADKLSKFLIDKMGSRSINPGTLIPEVNKNSVPEVNNNISNSTFTGDVLTRENTPMQKKVILTKTLGTSIFLGIFFAIFGVFNIYALLSKIISSISVLWIFLFVFFGIFLFVFTLTALITWFFSCIWYKNFYFKFDDEKGEIRSKVIANKISYLYYNRVQNVMIRQGWLERIFGLFTISIETAGEHSVFGLTLAGLLEADAEKVRKFVLERAKK